MSLQQRNKKKELLIFIVCLLVASVVLGGSYYYYSNYFQNNNFKNVPTDINAAQTGNKIPGGAGHEIKNPDRPVMAHVPSPFARISDMTSPPTAGQAPNLSMPAIPAVGLTLDGLVSPGKLKVKAIMTTDNRKMAVLILPSGQVIDVKEGDKVENEGTITKITAKGVYVGNNFFTLAPAENTAPSLSSLFERLK